MTLGERIKYLRKEKGLTQEDLAKSVGAIRGTLANWEVDAATPDKDTVIKIADYFDISVDYLYGRTENPHFTRSNNIKALAAHRADSPYAKLPPKALKRLLEVLDEIDKEEDEILRQEREKDKT